jgi:hypothetical protein
MSDVIREFLVSLGFKIDANGMRRFQDAVSGSTSSVGGLGRAAFDAALQVTDAVEKMAKQYESLSYASQRTGASTGNLKAAAYAFSQIGLSAEEGAAAIERFADLMMNNPGKKSFVEGWGATAEDTATKLKQFMHNIKKAYPKKEDYFVASRQAELGGVGNDIFKQYFNNSEEFDKYFDAYNKKLEDARVNTKRIADASKDFGRALTDLSADIDIMKTKLLRDLIPPAKDAVTWLDNLVQSINNLDGTQSKPKPSDYGWSWISDIIANSLPEDRRKEYLKGLKERAETWRDPSRDPLKPSISVLPKSMLHGIAGGADASGGVSANDLDTIRMIESGGRPNVQTGRYKGAFQLSDEEFRRYGGGNIWDAGDNRRAASAKLEAQKAAFRRRHGRDPSLTELYMMHQQGEGGAEAHMAHPERAAWLNMLSTAEGRKKGSKWAQQAIWGNVPSDMRKRFPGGVTDVTSQDFMGLWGEKVDRFSARLGGGHRGGDTQTPSSASEGGAADASSNPVTQNNSFSMTVNGVTDAKGLNSAAEEAFRMMSHYMAVGASGLR